MSGEGAEQAGASLAERELALREYEIRQKYALETSFPRKWGAVFWPGAVTLLVALVSGTFSIWQFNQTARTEAAARVEQTRLTEEARLEATRLRSIENGRAAIEMYFTRKDLFERADPNALAHLEMLIAISDNQGLVSAFRLVSDQIATRAGGAAEDAALAEGQVALAEGVPSLLGGNWDDTGAFTIYIQHVDAAPCAALARQVQERLAAAGYRVPGIDGIRAAGMPDATQFRFYSVRQIEMLGGILEAALAPLVAAGDISAPQDRVLQGNLPSDIFEFWLGRADCDAA